MIARFAIAAALTLAVSAAAAQTELKIAHFMSPKHPMHEHMLAPLVDELKQVSGGKLTARIYPVGELGKGPQLKRAQSGIDYPRLGKHRNEVGSGRTEGLGRLGELVEFGALRGSFQQIAFV